MKLNMCSIFWMHTEDIVNVAVWTMNNLCYEIAYSFGLGTDGEQNQQYMENAGRNTSQDFWNTVSRTLLFLTALSYVHLSQCLFAMISSLPQSTFLTISFPYLEEDEELNFQEKKKKKRVSLISMCCCFISKQTKLHFKNPGLIESFHTNFTSVHFSYTIF